jgi:hypothetical protein
MTRSTVPSRGVFLALASVDPQNPRNRESARIYITQDVSDATTITWAG